MKKVLLVEDDFACCENVSLFLKRIDYEVIAHNDAATALTALSDNLDINVLITDIEMPDMDGWDLIRTIRNELGKKELPVLVLTAHQKVDVERLFALGNIHYMTKPFDPVKIKSFLDSIS